MNIEDRTEKLKRLVLRLIRIDGFTVNDISQLTGVSRYTIFYWQVEQDDEQVERLRGYIPETELNIPQVYDL